MYCVIQLCVKTILDYWAGNTVRLKSKKFSLSWLQERRKISRKGTAFWNSNIKPSLQKISVLKKSFFIELQKPCSLRICQWSKIRPELIGQFVFCHFCLFFFIFYMRQITTTLTWWNKLTVWSFFKKGSSLCFRGCVTFHKHLSTWQRPGIIPSRDTSSFAVNWFCQCLRLGSQWGIMSVFAALVTSRLGLLHRGGLDLAEWTSCKLYRLFCGILSVLCWLNIFICRFSRTCVILASTTYLLEGFAIF